MSSSSIASIPIAVSQKKSFTLSLNKAQKVISKLKMVLKQHEIVESTKPNRYNPYAGHGGGGQKLEGTFDVSYSTANPLNQEEFCKNVTTILDTIRKKVETYFKLYEDLRHVKDMIFTSNIETGLSTVLSKIEYLSREKTVYQTLYDSIKKVNASTLTKDVTSAYTKGIAMMDKDNSTVTCFSVKLSLFEESELKDKIAVLDSDLDTLEDERDKLNANAKVTFKLYDETAVLLGLN